jgi:hypothetical protein
MLLRRKKGIGLSDHGESGRKEFLQVSFDYLGDAFPDADHMLWFCRNDDVPRVGLPGLL